MMQTAAQFLSLVFVGFVALFPPVNPIGSAFIINPLLTGLDREARKAAARKITTYCFIICFISVFTGSWILKLFGISLPVVQLAGGILICRMGWQMLSSDDNVKGSKESAQPTSGLEHIEDILFYPIAFPMTTGAGTISVLLTLSAHGANGNLTLHFINLGALVIAVLLICLLIYLCYANTPALIRRLGPRGEQIVNRISAFLVFCVGIQIATAGITHLVKG